MRKINALSVAVIAALCCVACSSSSGPEKVAKQAIRALQKKDYDAYAATFNLPPSDQEVVAEFAKDKVGEYASKGGIKTFRISDCQVDGDNAKVIVHIVFKDASEEDQRLDFVKVDGKWKQQLDK